MKPSLMLAGMAGALVLGAASDPRRDPHTDLPRVPSFRYEVLPLLQRQGCSSAYCHGSATGQAGFKLSLFGGDPEADYRAITTDLDGRRLDLVNPEGSLLLRKPSRALPHGGGLRLPRESAAYELFRQWIAAGAPRDSQDEAVPAALDLQVDEGRLRAVADFDDGTRRDVTGLCLLSSTAEDVAAVVAEATIEARAPGQTFFVARYGQLTAVLPHRVPFAEGVETPLAGAHPLDAAWLEHLGRLGLEPAQPADRWTLARRVHLDLAGRLPRPGEVRGFEVGVAADRLLESDDFARTWGDHLADWFEVGADDKGTQRTAFREAVAHHETLDALGARLLRMGHPLLQRHMDPRDRAEYVGRAFLGIRLGCARCHDHPLDRWRRSDHLAFSSLVATQRGIDGSLHGWHVYHPDTGEPVPAAPLPMGATFEDLSGYDLLRAFVLDGSHGAFARNLCNRVLAVLLGAGMVEPVDDHRTGNPPVCGDLLAAMVREYRATGGDLRALVKLVVTCGLYRAESSRLAESAEDGADARRSFLLQRRVAREMPLRLRRRAIAELFGADEGTLPALPDSPLAFRLALHNGPFLDAALSVPGNPVDAIGDFVADPTARLRELYLLFLSRPPRPAEEQALLPVLETRNPQAALRDLARALLLSREFGSLR